MADSLEKIPAYLNETKFIVLATVTSNAEPALRSLGTFAAENTTVYFSTGKATAKVSQIQAHPEVALLFQHENQELKSFVNISISGKAIELTTEADVAKAIAVLAARSPRFKERVEKKELGDSTFFKVEPKEIKIVDLGKGPGPKSVEIIKP